MLSINYPIINNLVKQYFHIFQLFYSSFKRNNELFIIEKIIESIQ